MNNDEDVKVCHVCGDLIPEGWRYVQAGDWNFHVHCWDHFKAQPDSPPITTASSAGEVSEAMPSRRKHNR